NVYYQAGPKNIRQAVMLDVIQQMMEKPFYHRLRTLEQLGYFVWSGTYPSNKVDGFFFMVQSDTKEPVYLQKRIERFAVEFGTILDNASDAEFDNYRRTLIAKRREKSKNLMERTRKYWHIVTSQSYDFDHAEREIDALETLKKEEVIQLYRKLFLTPETVKRATIQAVGKKHEAVEPTDRKIGDVDEFKKKQTYYHNPVEDVSGRLWKKTTN
ncbi:MAG: hypothetical protein GY866_17130, partial [Proteobacteria bacterium]|nr:hypothetical protein [Pseudomonadota bacterium]